MILYRAATLATQMRRTDLARSHAERLVWVNPWRWQYHQTLAAAQTQANDWRQAVEQCQRALELNPSDVSTRRLLVTCHARLGEKVRAQAEFDIVLAMGPADQQAALRRWFERTAR